MKVVKTSYDNITAISKFDLQFLKSDQVLKKYYAYTSDLDGIKQAILNKKSNYKFRKQLSEILKRQHANTEDSRVLEAIHTLKHDNCFCVTAAHQPCLFGGPAYFIYKIASTIHLANTLTHHFPEYKFVPVFYLGSEDHDFEEINHLNLFNNRIVWQKENHSGASGRLTTEGLTDVVQTILNLFENQTEKREILNILLNTSLHEQTYNLVIKHFIYQLFGEYGLVVVDPDDAELKRLMIPAFKDELLNQTSSKLLQTTITQLESDKVKVQAKGREINLFYLRDNLRERIVMENGLFRALNTEYCFTASEMESELQNHPERFSPNVILRPLFQESILPNVAFVGGGGEIAYWTELKQIFEYHTVQYPVLIRRNSVVIIDITTLNRLTKAGIEVSDLQYPFEKIEQDYLRENSEILDFSEYGKSINTIFEQMHDQVQIYDQNSTGRLIADKNTMVNKITEWEKKLNKQIILKHETKLNQMKSAYEKIFPGQNLQERIDSCIWLIAHFGTEIISFLVQNLDPLDRQFMYLVQQPDVE